MSKRSKTGITLDIANECRPDVNRWAKRPLLSILAVSSFEQCEEDRFLPLRLVFCCVRVLLEVCRLQPPDSLLPRPDERPPRPRPRPLPDEEPDCLLPGPRPRPVLPPLLSLAGWITSATADESSASIARGKVTRRRCEGRLPAQSSVRLFDIPHDPSCVLPALRCSRHGTLEVINRINIPGEILLSMQKTSGLGYRVMHS